MRYAKRQVKQRCAVRYATHVTAAYANRRLLTMLLMLPRGERRRY